MRPRSALFFQAGLQLLFAHRITAFFEDFQLPSFHAGGPRSENGVVQAVLHEPELTTSVPFRVGSDFWTFRVNITEVDPQLDYDGQPENPRIALTSYDIRWPGNGTLAATIAFKEGLAEDEKPRFINAVVMDLFSVAATNNYDTSHPGDCTAVVGEACVRDFREASWRNSDGEPTGIIVPQSCKDSITGWGYSDLTELSDTQLTLGQPFAAGGYSSALYSAGESDEMEQELERVHMVIFGGYTSSYPVCVRVKTDSVRRGSPAASPEDWAPKSNWVTIAGIVGIVFLIVLAGVIWRKVNIEPRNSKTVRAPRRDEETGAEAVQESESDPLLPTTR